MGTRCAWGASSASTSPVYRCRIQTVDLSPGSLRHLRDLMRKTRHRPGHPLKRHGGLRKRAAGAAWERTVASSHLLLRMREAEALRLLLSGEAP